jgi:hypothetical protein
MPADKRARLSRFCFRHAHDEDDRCRERHEHQRHVAEAGKKIHGKDGGGAACRPPR